MAIGQSKQRLDAEAKVTGRARYTDDMGLPGMRHAAYVHSTIAHGMVLSIDASEALALPGVEAVFTADDVPGFLFPTAGHPYSMDPSHGDVADRLLLTKHVRYYGDEVAVVVARDGLTARKAAQTTMYKILVALDKIIAPILCFTSQEIWDFLPKTEGMNKYVVFEAMPKAGQYAADDAFKAKWAQLIAVRDEVKKVLEQARAEKTIGASLEASVTLYCNDAVYDLLNSIPMDELADLMIVSHVELVKGEGGSASAVEGLGVAAAHATGEKCERCWKYSSSIGSHAAHPTLCARCASVVEA